MNKLFRKQPEFYSCFYIREDTQGFLYTDKQGAGRINKLHAVLLKEKRYADLERSTHDQDFQTQLMQQYGI